MSPLILCFLILGSAPNNNNAIAVFTSKIKNIQIKPKRERNEKEKKKIRLCPEMEGAIEAIILEPIAGSSSAIFLITLLSSSVI